jgi:hypothetical protein
VVERAARAGRRGTKTVPSPLAGKLFDQDGEPLYACGAAKGDRRYRYYVSRKLVRGRSDTGDRGWRLATLELERTVMAATRRLLSDHAALTNAVKHRIFRKNFAMDVSSWLYTLNAHLHRSFDKLSEL